jgi:hypothetical protein
MTGVSVVLLILSTVLGPLKALLNTTSLDVQQWLICTCVALSVIVVSEIRKAVRRRAAPATAQAGQTVPSPAGDAAWPGAGAAAGRGGLR